MKPSPEGSIAWAEALVATATVIDEVAQVLHVISLLAIAIGIVWWIIYSINLWHSVQMH